MVQIIQEIIEEGALKDKYIEVLTLFRYLPFNMGMNLLVQVLQGNKSNERIKKFNLHSVQHFGLFDNSTKDQIVELIKSLIDEKFIEYKEVPTNKWVKVLAISQKGQDEIKKPNGFTRALSRELQFEATPVTKSEEKLISMLRFYLEQYNPEQCHGIISEAKNILCVAGAGSGKTTVLTKRIEFLIKFKSISPQKILAVTFTKKAKHEMEERLLEMGVQGVNVETFNSFSERIIRKHWHLLYSEMKNMISYKDKIKIVLQSIKETNNSFPNISSLYFTQGQHKLKSQDQLLLSFVNDCFSVIDYYKSERTEIEPFHSTMKGFRNTTNAKRLYDVCIKINQLMDEQKLRDYADQVKDALTLFEHFPNTIPEFSHIFVDEYQDINSIQIKLLEQLNSENLFVVGDPRQAIFGWRGSRIEHIINMGEDENTTTIVLKENYRSHPSIVTLANQVIQKMKIADQSAGRKKEEFEKAQIKLFNFKNMTLEREFIVREIKNSEFEPHEIFVLSRTNRQLTNLSKELSKKRIPHVLKTDETRAAQVKKGSVTLATVHSIKGLEAEVVFVLGCNGLYFPCKVSDHPVIESLNLQDYNKEEEERRLFYVAITRAKQQLYLSYTGRSLTPFITKDAKKTLGSSSEFVKPISKVIKYTERTKSQPQVYANLKDWRNDTCRDLGVPAYMILSNRSIEELTQNMPINQDELYAIHGLGPRKIEKYGEDILRLVNS